VWVFYALLSAFSVATVDTISKKVMQQADERIVAWIRLLFACPYLIILLTFVEIPPLDKTLWTTVLILIPLELIALVLYVRAIKLSPLSITIPFLSLTPVFLILTGWLMLGEQVDMAGMVGIGLVVSGAYFLHIHTFRKGWLAPLRAIIQERGSRLMILVSFLYSITSNLGKIAILHSSPAAFGILYILMLTVAFFPVIFWTARPHLPQLKTHWLSFLAIGFFETTMILFHTLALAQTHVAYMIAVKRTSLLFSLAYGYLIFQETHLGQRLIGILLMLLGVILLSLQ
jgi:drug/metabolite transporter (DMT)-like permease